MLAKLIGNSKLNAVEESRELEPLQENERTLTADRGGIQLPQPKSREHLKKKTLGKEHNLWCAGPERTARLH